MKPGGTDQSNCKKCGGNNVQHQFVYQLEYYAMDACNVNYDPLLGILPNIMI